MPQRNLCRFFAERLSRCRGEGVPHRVRPRPAAAVQALDRLGRLEGLLGINVNINGRMAHAHLHRHQVEQPGEARALAELAGLSDEEQDRLVWDVGHQTYPHKILTGRRDRIRTLRMGGGLSGFTKRSESEYDPFGAAHSSTSISAGLGMAVARDLKGEKRNIIAVIGDGAMSAGMAYEAMNNAGASRSRLVIILNDNDMSISENVGALNNYLAKLMSGRFYAATRKTAAVIVPGTARTYELRWRKAGGGSTDYALLGSAQLRLGW